MLLNKDNDDMQLKKKLDLVLQNDIFQFIVYLKMQITTYKTTVY